MPASSSFMRGITFEIPPDMNRNLWLLVTATVVAGYYSANGQLYRFAAAELARPEYRERAVSMVLLRVRDDDDFVVRIRRFGDHAGLDAAQLRLADPGRTDRHCRALA